MLNHSENQLENLEAMKHHPHALEIATIERLIETYETQADYLQFLKVQGLQWRQMDDLTERQHDMLASLVHALTLTEKVIQTIFELAQHFLHGTVDSLIIEGNRSVNDIISTGNTRDHSRTHAVAMGLLSAIIAPLNKCVMLSVFKSGEKTL